LNERKNLRVEGDPSSHPVWRDRDGGAHGHDAARERGPRDTGAKVHVLHISTGEEMEFLAKK